jgi:hypothetical protein
MYHVRRVILPLAQYFLKEPGFPGADEDHRELYESLYMGLCQLGETNLEASRALLELAECRLKQKPQVCEHIWNHLHQWFSTPVPVLEDCVLEAFDLLAAYGLPGDRLCGWYRTWLVPLLGLPRKPDRADLQIWKLFGEWIQPGKDLTDRVNLALKTVTSLKPSPITGLPDGYRIGIFTLWEKTAGRAQQALFELQPRLDVRICTAMVLTDKAKALAQNVHLAVVVPSNVTHPLTEGIKPFLKHAPAYAPSRSSASIVKAIEASC